MAICENFWLDADGHYQTCDHPATGSVLDCSGFVSDTCTECDPRTHENPETEIHQMFGTTSEGRGQYGAGHRHVGEDLDTFVERSLEEGHQPDAIPYPQETRDERRV